MPKIIMLVPTLTGGGAERVAALWASGFCDIGYDVLLALSDDDSPITYTPNKKVQIKYITSHSKCRIIRYIGRLIKLRNIIRSEKPNYLIGVMARYSFWMYISSLGLHIPIIYTDHSSWEVPHGKKMPWELKFLRFHFSHFYDHVTVLTQADMNVIGKRIKQVSVLPNPLSFDPANDIPQKENVVLACGRLDEWEYKGFDLLIKAWGKVAPKSKGWRLQIVGGSPTGKGLHFLQNLSEEEGVSDSVDFPGYCKDVLPLYRKSSIFILSSRYEGFGMVLIEAMSQGCACIACDFKGRQKEIITSDSEGMICCCNDVEALSKSINSMIHNSTYRENVRQAAIERSRYYQVSHIMKSWNDILTKI